MTTLNQKLALNAKLHRALHRNVYLLSLHYAMNRDLLSHYKEGMLEKPNSAAFHHLSYYLMSIIDPNVGTTSSSWAIFEIKMEAKYRSEFLKFVNDVSKDHCGHISRIVASWIVNAGGAKVTKLMFELSQVALKVHLLRKNKKMNLNINDYNPEVASCDDVKERALCKISWWRTHSFNMGKIAEIYLRQIPILKQEINNHQAILKSLANNVSAMNPSIANELSDIFTPSLFLKIWGENIDRQIKDLNNIWGEKCVSILTKSQKIRNRSEQLIQMHLNKSSKDYVWEYDAKMDSFKISSLDNELSVPQCAILKSTVKDGMLDLPNFFRAYSVIISYCFLSYMPSFSSESWRCLLNDKNNVLMFVSEKSKDLVNQAFKFHTELKEGFETQDVSYSASESASGLLDVLNIPSFSMSASTNHKPIEYWQEALLKYKFVQFKHPFKSEKTFYVPEKNLSLHNISRIDKSIVRKGFLSSSKKPQVTRKIDPKPQYLRNIEELERNMFKIADVANKSFVPQHNMTTISKVDRRKSVFNQNHMKYLLTSIKKKSSVPDFKIQKKLEDKMFRKTWGNLFNESINVNSSLLQKTQSSPDLTSSEAVEDSGTINSETNQPAAQRISGIKEINYSSFLSDLGSLPNLYNVSDKENVPHNHQTVITETISIENKIEITETSSCRPPKTKMISPNRRKSVEKLVDTYRKFKEARGLGTKTNNEIKKDSNSNSRNLADSFLDKLDLGDNQNRNKRVIKKYSDLSRLSTVPDLLSPSVVLKSNTDLDI